MKHWLLCVIGMSGALPLAASPEGGNVPPPAGPASPSTVMVGELQLALPADADSQVSGPWLGVQVSKPDDQLRAQLPELPQGIGFLVRMVDPQGPAAQGGLREWDVIWKMDGQLLVNEGQLATLLRLKAPGESVKFEGFRGGKPIVQSVVIKQQQPTTAPQSMRMVAQLVPMDLGSMRVIEPGSRTATVQFNEGKASLQRTAGGDVLEIVAVDGKPVFSGTLAPGDALQAVPEQWRARVLLLRSGLEQALDGGMVPVRAPRQRVLPPPPAPEKQK